MLANGKIVFHEQKFCFLKSQLLTNLHYSPLLSHTRTHPAPRVRVTGTALRQEATNSEKGDISALSLFLHCGLPKPTCLLAHTWERRFGVDGSEGTPQGWHVLREEVWGSGGLGWAESCKRSQMIEKSVGARAERARPG